MSAYNRGCAVIAQILVTASGVKAMLVTPSYTFSRLHNTVSDVVANEVSGTNYTGGFGGSGRKTAASRSVSEDDTNSRAEFTCTAFTWSQINVGAVGGMVLFQEITNDASSDLIAFYALSGVVTNGGDLILTPDVEGLIQFSSP